MAQEHTAKGQAKKAPAAAPTQEWPDRTGQREPPEKEMRTRLFVLAGLAISFALSTYAQQKDLADPRNLALNEDKQVGVDGVGLRRDHAMRVVLVCLERAVLKELG